MTMKVFYLILLVACVYGTDIPPDPVTQEVVEESSQQVADQVSKELSENVPEESSGEESDDDVSRRVSPPPYLESKQLVDEVESKLIQHILSMADDIPFLNDHRRHYAEIFHVILYAAEDLRYGCVVRPQYFQKYQKNINESASEGISNPLEVINRTQALIDLFNEKTAKIQEIINKVCSNSEECDDKVDDIVSSGSDPDLKRETTILVAGGKAAEAFLKKHRYFLHVADNFAAHQYVIKGARKLKKPVFQLNALLRLIKVVRPC